MGYYLVVTSVLNKDDETWLEVWLEMQIAERQRTCGCA
jgi:hypothetical protein